MQNGLRKRGTQSDPLNRITTESGNQNAGNKQPECKHRFEHNETRLNFPQSR